MKSSNDRLASLLHIQLTRGPCNCTKTSPTINLTDEVKEITDFLCKRFSSEIITPEQAIIIFDEIIKKLENRKKQNINFYKKAVYVMLNYIKSVFFLWNTEMPNDFFEKYLHNPKLRPIFLEYLEDINKNIYNTNVDPYIEVAYSLYIQGIPGNYNIIYDLNGGNFSGIKQLLKIKINKIANNPSLLDITELCALFNTLNQFAIMQTISAEEKRIGVRLYREVLLGGIKEAIGKYLEGLNILGGVDYIVDTSKKIIFSEEYKDCLSEEQLTNLNQLQNLYGRLLCNFEGHVDYSSVDIKKADIKDVLISIKKLATIADQNTQYGLELRKSINYGVQEGSDNTQDIASRVNISAKFNRTYIQIIKIKKLKHALKTNGLFSEQERIDKEIELDAEKLRINEDIIGSYKEISKDSENIRTAEDMILHFSLLENPSYSQLVIIFDLILNNPPNVGSLYLLVHCLVNIKESKSAAFEKYKIRTLEIIIEAMSEVHNTCEEKDCPGYNNCANPKKDQIICKGIVKKIEEFIYNSTSSKEGNKRHLVYNYGKLYLSLAYLFSKGSSKEYIENAKTYFSIFQEKYSHIIGGSIGTGTVNKEEDTAINTRNEDNHVQMMISTIIENIERNEKYMYSIETSIKEGRGKYKDEVRKEIEKALFTLIDKIQTSRGKFGDELSSKIGQDICETISKQLFNGLCEIQIVPKGEKPKTGRFEKIEVIGGETFKTDIIFRYNTIHESSFNRLFKGKEKIVDGKKVVDEHGNPIFIGGERDTIKERLLLLIGLSADYVTMGKDFAAMVAFICRSMEQKDSYTKGHVKRVTEISVVIGRLLNLNYEDERINYICSLIHDYGKISIPDEILQKPGELTAEEKLKMAEHTRSGVSEGLKRGIHKIYLLGMMHHSKFWSPNSNEKLTFDGLIKAIEEGKQTDFSEYNQLAGNNIPYTSRIIMVGDVIDAIASRRIYDYRAGWSIEQIISKIDSVLLSCSGLKREGTNIIVDEKVWKKIGNKENINNPYRVEINGEFYIPTFNIEIIFDPSIIIALVGNEKDYENVKNQIIASDIENVDEKIIEIQDNIQLLKSKSKTYNKAIEGDFEREGYGENVMREDFIIYCAMNGITFSEALFKGHLDLIQLDRIRTMERVEKEGGNKQIFTIEDQKELERLKELLKTIKGIKNIYDNMSRK